MKPIILIFILSFISKYSHAQKSDSTILIQNTKLTNVEKEDIVEINKIRKIIIENVVLDATNHASKLFIFLKLDLHKKLGEYYFDDDRLKDEVEKRLKKITSNNFLVQFISKAKDRNGLDEFSDAYSFLVTFPFYYDYTHGYGYVSLNYLVKMQRILITGEVQKVGKFKMYPYKRINMNVEND